MKTIRMRALPLLLVVYGLAWGDYDEVFSAATVGDYATALREFRPLAKQGHSDAQTSLGFMY